MQEVLWAVVITYGRSGASRMCIVSTKTMEEAAKAVIDKLGYAPGMTIDVHVVGESERALAADFDRKALAFTWWQRAFEEADLDISDEAIAHDFENAWAEENPT